MSNPQTYYITMNQSTGQFQDLSGIFQPLSLGTQYPTATGFQLSTGQDLNQIFADISSGSPLGYNVNFISVPCSNQDLSQIFAKYNPIIYTITNQSNMNVTIINYGGYTALIFENTTAPLYPNAATNATCNITFNAVTNINILVVGGGSGGAGGYYDLSDYTKLGSGGGAGGAGYIYTSFSSVTGSPYSIQVGGGGPGRKVTNAGAGAEAGYSGGNSVFSLGGFSLNGVSGEPGYSASFTGSGYSGGRGGSSTSTLNNTGGGGGGGGGGGNDLAFGLGYGSPNANPTKGYLNSSYNPGNLGTNGGTITTANGGNGGNSYSNTINPPFLSSGSIYYGNGGGGGSYNNGGGKAGFTSGGNGYGSSAGSNGGDAIYGLSSGNYYYGNGGGGAATVPSPDNYGGNGGNGVVILWWLN